MMLTNTRKMFMDNKRVVFHLSIAAGILACLWSFDSIAMNMDHDTAMRDGLRELENTVKGGWARMAAIGAILIGFFMSMFKSSPNPIIISCVVVVIAKIVMGYADSAFTALI